MRLDPLTCDNCGCDLKILHYENDLNGSYFFCSQKCGDVFEENRRQETTCICGHSHDSHGGGFGKPYKCIGKFKPYLGWTGCDRGPHKFKSLKEVAGEGSN